jgi:HEAT repeat protein
MVLFPESLPRWDRLTRMRKKRPIGLASLLIVLLGMLTWLIQRSGEPVYHGRALSGWLKEFTKADDIYPVTEESLKSRNRAATAVRQIGTNALPVLVTFAGWKDSTLKQMLLLIIRSQRLVPVHLTSEKEYRNLAVVGFYALGPLAKDAVPRLTNLLNDRDVHTRLCAAECLGNIGPDAKAAIPHIVPFLSDTDRLVKWGATVTLGRIHAEAEFVVPLLINDLNPSNPILPTTISTLAHFGGQAKSAIPALVRLLNDNSDNVRLAATNALKQIDAEAAAKAGVR